MITTKQDVQSYRISEADSLTALDLNEEIRRADADGEPYETYILRLHDGGTEQSDAQLLYFPGAGRAGIAWGGDADWMDADSPDEAVGYPQRVRTERIRRPHLYLYS